MGADPKLRAVPDAPPATEERPQQESRSGPWVSILLGLLLAGALALLVWSRIELSESGQRIATLEGEARMLNQIVVERDAEIAAQRGRLSDVRTRVQSLLSLLDEPVAPQP